MKWDRRPVHGGGSCNLQKGRIRKMVTADAELNDRTIFCQEQADEESYVPQTPEPESVYPWADPYDRPKHDPHGQSRWKFKFPRDD